MQRGEPEGEGAGRDPAVWAAGGRAARTVAESCLWDVASEISSLFIKNRHSSVSLLAMNSMNTSVVGIAEQGRVPQ